MKEIDFIPIWMPMTEDEIIKYPYIMEVYEYGKPSGGCRTKNKDDLKAMYQKWKDTYGIFNLKYIFKKNEKIIDI